MSAFAIGRVAGRFSLLGRSRALLVMALIVGSLGTFAGQGTLAFVTNLVQSDNNIFNAGVLDIKGDPLLPAALRGTASTLPTSSFRWIRTGTQADCGFTRPATDDDWLRQQTQAMLPGTYCVAPVTIRNTSTRALDAWLRIRLYRQSGASPRNEAFNRRLMVYMSEYVDQTGSPTSGAAATIQSNDCKAQFFRPNDEKDTAQILDVSAAATGVARVALSWVSTSGKRIGADAPGGLGINAGGGTAPNDSNMVATGTSITASNLVGADQVVDPVLGGGSNARGTQAEALLLAGHSKYYCLALFLPEDTRPLTNITGDNAMQGASLTYYLVVTAAQRAGRTR